MSEEDKATDQYLEIYKLAVEMADRASARRASLITFPFTANTALFAVVLSRDFVAGVWIVAVVGLIISASWWALLKSYRDLNAAKFSVIVQMEKNLDAQIFDHEWKVLRGWHERRALDRYSQLGTVERWVPPIFAALYIAVLVSTLL
jgi:hypothetical protein